MAWYEAVYNNNNNNNNNNNMMFLHSALITKFPHYASSSVLFYMLLNWLHKCIITWVINISVEAACEILKGVGFHNFWGAAIKNEQFPIQTKYASIE